MYATYLCMVPPCDSHKHNRHAGRPCPASSGTHHQTLWVSYFIGVALIFYLSMLLLFLTDCVLPGVTQSQLPLHLLWLGIELWLSAGGSSRCFPLLCCLKLGFQRLRLLLLHIRLPLRMCGPFPCVVLAIVVIWPVATMVYAEADMMTIKRCYPRLKAAVSCCWCTSVTCLQLFHARRTCQ